MGTPTTGYATAIRKFFQDDSAPVSLKEIKEFKTNDPDGYDEIGKLCLEHINKKAA